MLIPRRIAYIHLLFPSILDRIYYTTGIDSHCISKALNFQKF